LGLSVWSLRAGASNLIGKRGLERPRKSSKIMWANAGGMSRDDRKKGHGFGKPIHGKNHREGQREWSAMPSSSEPREVRKIRTHGRRRKVLWVIKQRNRLREKISN